MYRIKLYLQLFFSFIFFISLLSCNTKKDDKKTSKNNYNSTNSTATSKDTMSQEELRESIAEKTNWGELEDSTDEFTGYRQINTDGMRPIWIERGPGNYGGAFMKSIYIKSPEEMGKENPMYSIRIYTLRDKGSDGSLKCLNNLSETAYILADGERIKMFPQSGDAISEDGVLYCPKNYMFLRKETKDDFRKIAYSDTVRIRHGKYTFTIPKKSRIDMRKIWSRTQ